MVSSLAIRVSLQSVLNKLILVGTVNLKSLGKVAVVAKRLQVFGLWNQPSICLFSFWYFLYGVPDSLIYGSD